MIIRSHTSSTTSAGSSGSSPQQPSPSTGAEDRAGTQIAEIQKYNRQTNQLSIHYFAKKVMDLGVLFLPNSVKKYLTTPPTKDEISHAQHHQRTIPYTLNLPASFMIHKVWISFQVYKWHRTAVDKNYGSLHKKVRFHIYTFLPFLANPWKWDDKDYVARFQQFNVAQLANYITVGVLCKVVTYSSWWIRFVPAIAHQPAASCMIISILSCLEFKLCA